jgi:hypothetical protein
MDIQSSLIPNPPVIVVPHDAPQISMRISSASGVRGAQIVIPKPLQGEQIRLIFERSTAENVVAPREFIDIIIPGGSSDDLEIVNLGNRQSWLYMENQWIV